MLQYLSGEASAFTGARLPGVETLWNLLAKGGDRQMKLLDIIIKLLHIIAIAGTWAAVLETVLKAIFS